jgi:hypothetical protein
MFVQNREIEIHNLINDNKQGCSCIILVNRVKQLTEVFYLVEFGVYVLKMLKYSYIDRSSVRR